MNIIFEILNSPWFILPEFEKRLRPIANDIVKNFSDHNAAFFRNGYNPLKNGSVCVMADGAPFISPATEGMLVNPLSIIEPSLFICTIDGPVVKYNMCDAPGCVQNAEMLKLADKNPNIFAHLICVESPGGSGYAARYMSEAISGLSKPVFGFIRDMACSGGYWIVSVPSVVCANNAMAQVGCIGTYLNYFNDKKHLENEGYEEVQVYAPSSPLKNKEYREAEKGNFNPLEQLAEKFNQFFLQHVSKSRSGKLKSDKWQSGDTFFADEALQLGLIDMILPFDDFIIQIFNEFSPKSPNNI